MIYLASPYTDTDPAVMEWRYQETRASLAQFLRDGFHVYSPIVMCHPLAVEYELPKDHEFWQAFDRNMIDHAHELWVLMLPGWRESAGVTAEVAYALEIGLEVIEMEPTPTEEPRDA